VERELLPWGLDGVELGGEVLEIGPGFGATTRVLVRRPIQLSVVEIDERYCRRLRSEFGGTVDVRKGDASELPFGDESFSSAVCFTMLHHIPSAELQDRTFFEVARVLRPGGVFAGTDSVGSGPLFKLIHIGDTLNLLDPDRLPSRLTAAGFDSVSVDRTDKSIRFRASRAG
jgi:SAM-dependent methyltransferase